MPLDWPFEPTGQKSHRLALTTAWLSRLVGMQRTIVIMACRAQPPQARTHLIDLLLHLVRTSRPDQCLRSSPEDNGLGSAKVGLGLFSNSSSAMDSRGSVKQD